MPITPRLILASSSPYRKLQLEQLQLPFSTQNPDIDESAYPDESATTLVRRLALEKAEAIAKQIQEPALIIGSDQVALLDETILGKPGTHERALAQLRACQGKTVQFLTGLCLFDTATQSYQLDCIPFNVTFKTLRREQLDRYLKREQPYQCAGSFMCEGLGVALFEKLSGDDPNALIGLPLIRLSGMLSDAGIEVL